MINKISIENRWIGFLFIFYLVGIIGMSIPSLRGFFIPLTPLNLLLTLVVFYKVNNTFSGKFLFLSVFIFLIGFSIEAIGVATGILFGNYWYGEPFGVKVFETPIMIGVNWLFLSLSTYGIVQYFTKIPFLLILLPPFLMVGLDFLVEPVAMKLGFWNWEHNTVPLQNYGMWFATSLGISLLIYFFKPTLKRNISFAVYGAQLVFFGVLNVVL